MLIGAVRRTRKEMQAETRARLIAVAREHFLRYGLGGAVVEKIAEEAGFTRGALYANFDGREELFLAVIQSSVDAEVENFRAILASDAEPRERLTRMREAFGDVVTNGEWVLLEAEFQANALRSSAIRRAFVLHLNERVSQGAKLLRQFGEQVGLVLRSSPEEIALVLGSLAEGLGVRQTISDENDREAARALAMRWFDRIVLAEELRD